MIVLLSFFFSPISSFSSYSSFPLVLSFFFSHLISFCSYFFPLVLSFFFTIPVLLVLILSLSCSLPSWTISAHSHPFPLLHSSFLSHLSSSYSHPFPLLLSFFLSHKRFLSFFFHFLHLLCLSQFLSLSTSLYAWVSWLLLFLILFFLLPMIVTIYSLRTQYCSVWGNTLPTCESHELYRNTHIIGCRPRSPSWLLIHKCIVIII